MDRGFARVRPLAGGLDAWEQAGYALVLVSAPGITPGAS
jgi:rhodanese-related sulfurtransferase